MPDPGPHKISVRATRSYLAGAGTSGSLLAGAAVLFLIGSAIVAFRGWPQIATGPVTSNVAAAPLAAHSRPVARPKTAFVTQRRAAVRGGSAAGGTRGALAHRRTAVKAVTIGSVKTTAPGSGSGSGGSGGSAGGSPPAGTAGCGCGGSGTTGPRKVFTTIARTVSNVGNDVGQQITGISGAVAGPVSSASPQAGSAVGQAGATLGSTVTSATNSVANTITTLGNTVGGGGGG